MAQAATLDAPVDTEHEQANEEAAPVKRGPGRPRIHPLEDGDQTPRRRGRPKGSRNRSALARGRKAVAGTLKGRVLAMKRENESLRAEVRELRSTIATVEKAVR